MNKPAKQWDFGFDDHSQPHLFIEGKEWPLTKENIATGQVELPVKLKGMTKTMKIWPIYDTLPQGAIPNGPMLPARNTDPATSHAAAKSLKLPRLEQLVLQAIRAYPEGCIADQICLMADLEWRTCTPRIAPLLRKGLVVDTGQTRAGASGRQQRIVRAI